MSNILYDRPQPLLLHSIQNMWIQPSEIWLPPRFIAVDPEINLVMKYTKRPKNEGIHNPHLQTEEENRLHYHFKKTCTSLNYIPNDL